MSQLVAATTHQPISQFVTRYTRVLRPLGAALLVSFGYFLGAKIGFALTFKPYPVSTLWPPNAILFAALILAPKRWWWFLVLAAFPAHLLVQVDANVPLSMILSWFVSNCSEALLGAWLVRHFIKEPVRFETTHEVGCFLLAALVTVFVSTFLDAALVVLNDYGDSPFWHVFRMRFFSNVLASVTLVPLIVTWSRVDIAFLKKASPRIYLEGGVLAVGLLILSLLSFVPRENLAPALLYLPLPLLLWAAIRFGPKAASLALLTVSFFTIWGAIHGLGPFSAQSPEMSALSVQLFLILSAMPLLFLAALIAERKQSQEAARQREARLEMALEAAQMGSWDWRLADDTLNWSNQTKRIFGLSNDDQEPSYEGFYAMVHQDDRAKIREAAEHSIRTGAPFEWEFRVSRKDGPVRWIRAVGKLIADEAGFPNRMMGLNVDVTERKLREEAFHETSERNRAILRTLPDLVFVMTNDGVYLDCHAREPNTFFVPPESFLGKNVSDVLPPDLAERVKASLAKTATKDEPQILEYSLPMEGEDRHFEARLIGMEGGKTLSIVREVTDRQRATQALRYSQENLNRSHNQVRALLRRLIDIQESERRRISRELHDDLSQRIATLSISISRIMKSLPPSEVQLISELDELRANTNGLTTEVRNLSHRLHPAVLEHLGLVTALHAYIDSFRTEENIEVSFRPELGDRKAPFPTAICIYRVAVETLRNVARHSGATSAVVLLKQVNDSIELQISDDGRGFDVETARKGNGLGLISIEERVNALEGSCEIHSTPGNGTTIIARVPVTQQT